MAVAAMLFVSALSICTLHAQPVQGADSLWSRLQTDQSAVDRCSTLIYYADLIVADSFSRATDLFKEAAQMAEDEQFFDGAAMANNSLMAAYTTKGAYALALEYGQKSLKAAYKTQNNNRVANTCINLGNIHFYIQSLDEAMHFYKEALVHLGTAANPFRTSVLMLNMGAVYQEMERPDSAIVCFELSMASVGRMEHPSDYMYSALHNNLGNLYLDRGNYQEALVALLKALDHGVKSTDPGQVATVKMNLALAYAGLKQWDLARQHLNSADSMITQNELGTVKPELLEAWASFYEGQGLFEQALAYRKDFETAKDSLEGQQNKETIAQLQAAYGNEMQRDRIALLEYEGEKRREAVHAQSRMLILVAGSLGLALLIMVLLLRYYRRQQRLNLELANLNREKDGLISMVAHDLKSPLNKSRMLVELLRSTTNPDPAQIKLLAMIDKVCTEGGTLIQDLLEITLLADERQPQQQERFRLGELLSGISQQFAADAARKEIEIHLDLDSSEIEIVGDRHRLARVLDNLVSNAIKFSPPKKAIYLAMKRDGASAQLSVRDEGPGISTDDQRKMFGKFQKLSARPTAGESSNGLGLSIVKALVDRLDAQLEVKSALGVGTEFVLKIPMS